jgi:hypothetical protein
MRHVERLNRGMETRPSGTYFAFPIRKGLFNHLDGIHQLPKDKQTVQSTYATTICKSVSG